MPARATRQQQSTTWHSARHFDAAPGIARSLALLEEIDAGEPTRVPVSLNMPIGLYGAGNLGHMARDFLESVWCDFDFVVDRNADLIKNDPAWKGKPVYRPNHVPEALKSSHQLLVTVATAPQAPLESELAELGFRNIVPFYDFSEKFRHLHPLSNGWLAEPLSVTDKAMAGAVLAGFADDISRAHHLQFLAWRRLRQEWTFTDAPVTGNDRFFIPELMASLRPGEVFLDAGAHHGSVSLDFDRRRPDWKNIAAVEPDPYNRAILEPAFSERWPMAEGRRPIVLGHALGAHDEVASFHSGLGYASQLAATGRLKIEVKTIDALEFEPTFIKLHIEGAELDTLKGAWATLRKHRPIVAATVYHNDDGIWKTPLWLMRAVENYSFLFRVHSWCGTGAVLYAIPAERMSA
jgi:FkbM family methyltransferase